jgi:hypothetical protein
VSFVQCHQRNNAAFVPFVVRDFYHKGHEVSHKVHKEDADWFMTAARYSPRWRSLIMNNKFDESQIIDGFSVLEMKQTIQEEIIRRTQGMSYQELRHYLDESLKDKFPDGFVTNAECRVESGVRS